MVKLLLLTLDSLNSPKEYMSRKLFEASLEDSGGSKGVLSKWAGSKSLDYFRNNPIGSIAQRQDDLEEYALSSIGATLIPSGRGSELGSGAYGSVHECLWNGKRVAVKITQTEGDYVAYKKISELAGGLPELSRRCLPVILHQEIVDLRSERFQSRPGRQPTPGPRFYLTVLEFLVPVPSDIKSHLSLSNADATSKNSRLHKIVDETMRVVKSSISTHLTQIVELTCGELRLPEQVTSQILNVVNKSLAELTTKISNAGIEYKEVNEAIDLNRAPRVRLDNTAGKNSNVRAFFSNPTREIEKILLTVVQLPEFLQKKIEHVLNDSKTVESLVTKSASLVIKQVLEDVKVSDVRVMKVPRTLDLLKSKEEENPDLVSTRGVKNKNVQAFMLGLKGLEKHGILYSDAHSSNIMQRPNGQIVLVDVGMFSFA